MLGICLKGPPGRKGAVEKNILESPKKHQSRKLTNVLGRFFFLILALKVILLDRLQEINCSVIQEP